MTSLSRSCRRRPGDGQRVSGSAPKAILERLLLFPLAFLPALSACCLSFLCSADEHHLNTDGSSCRWSKPPVSYAQLAAPDPPGLWYHSLPWAMEALWVRAVGEAFKVLRRAQQSITVPGGPELQGVWRDTQHKPNPQSQLSLRSATASDLGTILPQTAQAEGKVHPFLKGEHRHSLQG